MFKNILKKLLVILCIGAVIIACGGGGGSGGGDETPEVPETPPPVNSDLFVIGTAPYAIQQDRFNCEAYINSIAPLPELRVSWLWNTFGRDTTCLNRVLTDPRLREIQVHVINDVCVRNKNCGPYEALAGFSVGDVRWRIESGDPVIRDILSKAANDLANFLYNDFKIQEKNIRCYISPLLETNITNDQFGKIAGIFRDAFPGCSIVHNPVNSNSIAPGADYLEKHNPRGFIPAPCTFNNDGVSVKFDGKPNGYPRLIGPTELSDSFKNFRHCAARYVWHHSYNCIRPDLGFVDPRDRPCNETDTWNDLVTIILNGN